MGSIQIPALHRADYNWNQQILDPESVNVPAVDSWGEGLDGTLLELFLEIPEGSPKLRYLVPEIEAICSPETLQRLWASGRDTSHEIIAWLDERSHADQERRGTRWYRQASLYAALKEKVRQKPAPNCCLSSKGPR